LRLKVEWYGGCHEAGYVQGGGEGRIQTQTRECCSAKPMKAVLNLNFMLPSTGQLTEPHFKMETRSAMQSAKRACDRPNCQAEPLRL
jgi:hypothetical protein